MLRSRCASLAAFLLFAVLSLPANAQQNPDPVPASNEPTELPSYRTYQEKVRAPAIIQKTAEQIESERVLNQARAESCEAGNLGICFELAQAYAKGDGAPQNRPVAAELYDIACQAGHAESCTGLGQLYEFGTDDQAPGDAIIAHEQACALGSLAGCRRYATLLDRGFGIDADPDRAEALMESTCQSYDAEACRLVAGMRLRAPAGSARWWSGFDSLDALCRDGDPKACGDGIQAAGETEPEYEYGLSLFYHFDCANGNADSCDAMGNRAFQGYGLAPDRDIALTYYDRACALREFWCSTGAALRSAVDDREPCDQGDMQACTRLGDAYLVASPIEDRETAIAYFSVACEGGVAAACGAAAARLYTGSLEAQTERGIRGADYYRRGCELGDSQSCVWVAQQLRFGEGVERDLERAASLFAVECERGVSKACEELETLPSLQPDVPLALADDRFVPPIEYDEAGFPLGDWMPDDMRAARMPACTSSEVLFRGTLYADKLCLDALRSVGGYRMRPGGAPWQALIWRPAVINGVSLEPASRVKCGGSVIKSGWILTAAHCLTDENESIEGRGYRVRLGVYNPQEDQGISYPIRAVYPYRSYDKSTYAYDIALIRYDASAGVIGERVDPIAQIELDTKTVLERTIEAGTSVYSYGWGWTKPEGGQSTDYMQGVKMITQSKEDCDDLTEYDEGSDIAICAVGRNGAQSCKGDSGGPLITYGGPGSRPVLIGVVSWGKACGSDGDASAFTRVAPVKYWIDNKMRPGR